MSDGRYTTTIRLGQDEVDAADRIAKQNGYGNRSDAIRYAINTFHSGEEQLRNTRKRLQETEAELRKCQALIAMHQRSHAQLMDYGWKPPQAAAAKDRMAIPDEEE